MTEDNARLKKKYRKIKKRNAELELALERAKKEKHLQRFLTEQSGWKRSVEGPGFAGMLSSWAASASMKESWVDDIALLRSKFIIQIP